MLSGASPGAPLNPRWRCREAHRRRVAEWSVSTDSFLTVAMRRGSVTSPRGRCRISGSHEFEKQDEALSSPEESRHLCSSRGDCASALVTFSVSGLGFGRVEVDEVRLSTMWAAGFKKLFRMGP